jgi:hypothetical protein
MCKIHLQTAQEWGNTRHIIHDSILKHCNKLSLLRVHYTGQFSEVLLRAENVTQMFSYNCMLSAENLYQAVCYNITVIFNKTVSIH